ncbi:minor capsid protein [Thermolongibacillus altinsuensis]
MNNFEKSLLKLVDELFQLTDKEHREILQLYKQSNKNIKQFISDLFMRYGQDGKLEMSEVQKYGRMAKLEEMIQQEMKQLAKAEAKTMYQILTTIYSVAFYKTAYTFEKNMGAAISFKLLRKEFIDEVVNFNWSGIPFSERIWSNVDNLVKSLRTELYQGIQNGESLDKIAKRINGQFKSGINRSQRLIRTESARVISSAQEKIYKDSGVVQYLMYTATLDNRTSDICRSRDGRKWRIDDPNRPKIPAHPNCRSCWIPVIEGYEPKKRKDNETKQIIEYKNYEDWYNSRVNQ